jgi:hypothetical protein
MKEGFYYYGKKVYFGLYDESQVSGYGKISALKPELIKSDRAVGKDDTAVYLWDNHSLLSQEYEDLQATLLKMRTFVNLDAGLEIDFSAVEKRLNFPFPKELKLIYSAIQNQKEYFAGAEHFLLLDEIYVEGDVIVFFQKKRSPVAGYHIASGCLARFYKKEWLIDRGDICCYQFCLTYLLTLALESKPVQKKGRCKGSLVTTLNIEKELENYCGSEYCLLRELNVYGIAVMYSNEKLIAYIRSNGFYADIRVGALQEAHWQALCDRLGDAVRWADEKKQ